MNDATRDSELQAYADLVHLYPDNPGYLKRYAELLLEAGQIATATEAFRSLHALLLKLGRTKEAEELVTEHPEIGRISSVRDDLDIRRLLPEEFNSRLWQMMHRERLKEGQTLFREGEPGDTVYLVLEGELAILHRTSEGRTVLLNLVEAGDVVGEGCLLDPGPRSAEVVANRDSVVVKLPRKRMLAAMAENPGLEAELKRKSDFRTMVSLVSMNPVLMHVPLDMRHFIARQTRLARYPAGATIHKAGDDIDAVDMLVRGRAAYVWNHQGRVIVLEELAVGALAGDASAIRKATVPADMQALDDALLAHIPLNAFKTVVEGYPPLKELLFRHAEKERERLFQRISRLGLKTGGNSKPGER